MISTASHCAHGNPMYDCSVCRTAEEIRALRAKLQAAEIALAADDQASHIIEWMSRAEAAEAKMDNLAALVRVLVHSLRKVNPNSSNIIRAMDYLTRTGLTGSILRDDEVKP